MMPRSKAIYGLEINWIPGLSSQLNEAFSLPRLGVSELLALRWKDVDWIGSSFNVEHGIVHQRLDSVKTEESCNSMTLDRRLLSMLSAWRQQFEFRDAEDWIFPSPVKLGRLPYSYAGYCGVLQDAGIAAGLGKLGMHTLRHTYRSWLDAVGTAVTVQQKLMRHSDIHTTLNIYGDVVTTEMKEASSRVANLALQNWFRLISWFVSYWKNAPQVGLESSKSA